MAHYTVRTAGFLLLLTATASADVVTNPLQGPFASRAAACEAVLGSHGKCLTYRAQSSTSASKWDAVEIGVVGDSHAKTKHFGVFVRAGTSWFGDFLGTDGVIDTEFFPPCDRDSGVGSCTPFHRDMPSNYTVPKLSWVAFGSGKQLVMFYPTPTDVGFRQTTPNGELLQVCRLVAGAPECSVQVLAVPKGKPRVTSAAGLFTAGELTTVALH